MNVLISGKVTTLPKVIKYVKRSKYSQRKTYAKCYFKMRVTRLITILLKFKNAKMRVILFYL